MVIVILSYHYHYQLPHAIFVYFTRISKHRKREAGIIYNSLYSGTSSVTTGPEDVYQEAGIDYSDKDPGL